MKAMINVCKGCTDRYRIITEDKITDCHDHCRKYQEAKEEYEAKRDAFKKSHIQRQGVFQHGNRPENQEREEVQRKLLGMMDNYDAWVNHCYRQETYLERLPKCCVCGEPIQQEMAVKIGSDWYCDACLDDFREIVEGE